MMALEGNSHLLIEGGAGTGKTLLATDFARRKAVAGERVLYLTFNKNLSNNINNKIGAQDNLKIINIHALFGEYVPVDTGRMTENPQRYFGDELPEKFFNWISGLPENEVNLLKYDLLVMDEGQDIIKPIYLYSLDILLKDGFEKGKWAIFYDEKQNIYNPEYADGMELLESYNSTKFQLFMNCRNTVQIGTYSSKVSGIEIRDYLQANGEEVQKKSYVDESDFKIQIKEIVKMLRAEKIMLSDVVFLSPKKYANSLLHAIGFEVNELGDNYNPRSVLPKFATIQGFKGLDEKIVILVDVDAILPQNISKLFYIAATRARLLLYVVASSNFLDKYKF